ncbi:hypothetical protein QR680_016947 [Steinernema hermaphroditum]|uniref:ATP-dependent RNA helicase n=1 Tax=Steinernema hermaphroditum TaxID=289476 RepID=A0AA39LN57_9BILA|nr:hypothetical protein QR680_016947 [Steinernema hermaphroditum]
MHRPPGSSSSSDDSSKYDELLRQKYTDIPKRSGLLSVIRRPLGLSSSSGSDSSSAELFDRVAIPKVFAIFSEKQESATLESKIQGNEPEQPVTNAQPGRIIAAKPGKGSGMARNSHVSEQNRIVSGIRFEELTDITQIHIQGGDGTTAVLRSFKEAELPSELLKNLLRMGISKPTAVQCATLSLMIRKSDFDIIAQDQTGSGKTAAYLLPIIKHIHDIRNRMQLSHRATAHQPFAVVVLPTRELVGQVAAEAANLVKNLSVRVAESYGQMDMSITMQQLRVGCDILIGTPGRIIAHTRPHGPISVQLNRLKWTVIDEADHFLRQDRKVFETVMEILSQLHERLYVFSATFDQYVVNTYKCYMKPTPFEIIGRQGMPNVALKWRLIESGGTLRKLDTLLADILEIDRHNEVFPKTVIFTNQKRRCSFVAFHLALHHIKAIFISGDMTQEQRERMIERFALCEFKILVCTDIAARGLNMKDVQYVINFDFPVDTIRLQHRVGRTARLGNKGTAYIYFDLDPKAEGRRPFEILEFMNEIGRRPPKWMYKCALVNPPTDVLSGEMEPEDNLCGFNSSLGDSFQLTEI